MRLGILKTDDIHVDLVGQHGEYPHMFAELLQPVEPTLELVAYEVQRGEYPEHIQEVDAYLITGSKASVYDDLPWIAPLEEFIRQLHAEQKPVVGICFGHQLIASALGGRTVKSEKGWGVGVHSCVFRQSVEGMAEAGEQFKVYVNHQDQVVALPEGAEVLAGNEFCPNGLMRIDRHMLSWQGHPEFSEQFERDFLDLRRDLIPPDRWEEAQATMDQMPDQDRIARWIVEFLKQQDI